MSVLGVIPARWASTRFPGKPLAPIAGRPMIQHVWDRASGARALDGLVIATDDERIRQCCEENGMDVLMTGDDHETGTDRLAEVAGLRAADIYINVQGDEPLIDPAAIDDVTECLLGAEARGIEVATGYVEGATEEQLANPSVVHLVPTLDGCVLTFSREPVPHSFAEPAAHTVHVGMYGFTAAALARFARYQRGPVERAESIELMRFLEHGERIAAIPIPPGSIGVDWPDDIKRVEAVLGGRAAEEGA
jgi:3-deoxy-manno-octulosonate cytidylyltransferase (CMP-KDO synthetase)